MKLAISNIGWENINDTVMYKKLVREGYQGVEIAPTRIFPRNPYNDLKSAKEYKSYLKSEYGLAICSLQSIWFGRQENLFGTCEERKQLIEYTKTAIQCAEILDCHNLVFGCPKNRVVSNKTDYDLALTIFSELGNYAWKHSTILSMEANPTIYNTNFINTTEEAFKIVQDVNSPGFKVNLDLGTMIENNETLDLIGTNLKLINHIHISEPRLKPIKERTLHKCLFDLLSDKYDKYISIEMEKQTDLYIIEKSMRYVKKVFGGI